MGCFLPVTADDPLLLKAKANGNKQRAVHPVTEETVLLHRGFFSHLQQCCSHLVWFYIWMQIKVHLVAGWLMIHSSECGVEQRIWEVRPFVQPYNRNWNHWDVCFSKTHKEPNDAPPWSEAGWTHVYGQTNIFMGITGGSWWRAGGWLSDSRRTRCRNIWGNENLVFARKYS